MPSSTHQIAHHGTNSRYTAGCRCAACRSAHAISQHLFRERRKHRGQQPTRTHPDTPTAWRCPQEGCSRLNRIVDGVRQGCACPSPLDALEAARARVRAECRDLRLREADPVKFSC